MRPVQGHGVGLHSGLLGRQEPVDVRASFLVRDVVDALDRLVEKNALLCLFVGDAHHVLDRRIGQDLRLDLGEDLTALPCLDYDGGERDLLLELFLVKFYYWFHLKKINMYLSNNE